MAETLETPNATRRGFLGAAAMTAASYNRVLGANDRIGLGFIGFGLIGKQHIGTFKEDLENVDMVGICDCYKPRVEEALAFIGNPNTKGYSDFRKMYENKDIQGVVVATPDHWHALQTIMACGAGKDVYVEKPMTLFVDEGKWMVQAARKYKRIVVVGTQRRHGSGVAEAKKVVESGVLGKVHSVSGAARRNVWPGFGKTPVEEPPPGMDYEMWLGPSAKTPYQNHRSIYHFRWFRDYSGGQIANLGAHAFDQILWIMGAKQPELVMCSGGRFVMEDDGDTPDTQDASWVFPDKWSLSYSVREASAMRGSGYGTAFQGTKGTMILAGSPVLQPEMHGDPMNSIPRFLGHPTGGVVYSETKPEPWFEAPKEEARPGPGRRPRGPREDTMLMNHSDWLNSIRTRERPLCEVEDGYHVSLLYNLANMSMDLGRSIRWDPKNEVVIGDKEAAARCRKPYRAPWDKVLRSYVQV